LGENTIDDRLYNKLDKKFATVSNFIDGEARQLGAKDVYQNMTI
jgi:hypothetical protein